MSAVKYILICTLVAPITLFSQSNNSIFNGGDADGFALDRQSLNVNNAIFAGASGDGYDVYKGEIATNSSIYNGGVADGFVKINFTRPSNSDIYAGGSQDGFSYTVASLISNNDIFTGGSTDGYVVVKSSPTASNDIFAGGFGDGHDRRNVGLDPLPLAPRTIIYVDSTANGFNTGESWLHAFKELRDGVQFSNSSAEVDTIAIARGTYTPTATTSRSAGYLLSNAVEMYGGFPSGGGTFGTRDPIANKVRLSGDLGEKGVGADNSYHVVLDPLGGDTTLLDGLIIEDGYADGIGITGVGAAVIGVDIIHLRNVSLRNNYGVSEGSTIFMFNGTNDLILTDVELFPAPGSHPTQIFVQDGKTTVNGTVQIHDE